LKSSRHNIDSVSTEVAILKMLAHKHVVKLYEYGDQGRIEKPSGRVIEHVVYTVMELCQGELLFDVC
jgi:serine/threonine protein kinase